MQHRLGFVAAAGAVMRRADTEDIRQVIPDIVMRCDCDDEVNQAVPVMVVGCDDKVNLDMAMWC